MTSKLGLDDFLQVDVKNPACPTAVDDQLVNSIAAVIPDNQVSTITYIATIPPEKPPQPESHKCQFCDMIFNTAEKLEAHARIHPGNRKRKSKIAREIFECHHCEVTFNSKPDLDYHALEHTTPRGYRCVHCDIYFTQPTQLKRHMDRHSTMKIYKCEFCVLSFSLKTEYNAHVKIHKPSCKDCGHIFNRPSSSENHTCKRISNVFKCADCDVECSSKRDLVRHCNTHIMSLDCGQCSKKFGSAASLKRHLKRHDNPKCVECGTCGEPFLTRNALKNHVLKHMDGYIKQYTCHKCGKQFKYFQSLARHINVHSPTQPIVKLLKCPECKLKFPSQTELSEHLPTHMMNPMRCKECKEYFSDYIYLQAHAILHTGADKIQCLQCEELFDSEQSLRSHSKEHPPIPIFKCHVDDEVFLSETDRAEHEKSHISLRDYCCGQCGTGFRFESKLRRRSREGTSSKSTDTRKS